MAQKATTSERVSADELSEGDKVTVHVNDRASNHLDCFSFEAIVNSVMFEDIQFKRIETDELHTWYSDIAYIHGYHKGLERQSDIGKVRKVTR